MAADHYLLYIFNSLQAIETDRLGVAVRRVVGEVSPWENVGDQRDVNDQLRLRGLI